LDSLEDCLAQADVVLITTPDPAFQPLTAAHFDNGKPKVTVVDCWRILDKELMDQPHIRYIPIGRSMDDAANERQLAELWNNTARVIE
jgi:predicted dinucleotide-binding enzyme